MKTKFQKTEMKSIFFHFMLTCILGVISCQCVTGQVGQIKDHDYLMPEQGKSMVSFNSGIPYVALGEYTYGFSHRIAVGVLYGYTPIVLGYGVRIKAVVAEPYRDLRILLKMPVIYYPHAKNLGGDPWILTWPTLSIEGRFHSGARIWSGIGVIAASCVDALFENKKGMDDDKIMSNFWNTIQFGFCHPFSNKVSWSIEIAPVLKGLKLAGEEWIAGPPLVMTLGASYSF